MTKDEILQIAKTTNNTNTIQMILDFSNNELLLTLFDNPNLTKDNRKHIIDNADFTAYDISNILEELAESKLDSNKLLVINHKACTLKILNKIANDTDDEKLLSAIIQNKNCSAYTILNIMKKSYRLHQQIFDVLLKYELTGEQIILILKTANTSKASCLFALAHKNCTAAVLEYISKQTRDEDICDKVLRHKLVNVNTLVNYINDTYWVRNPKHAWDKLNELFPDVVTAEFIDKLLRNDNIRIKEDILAHKNCPLETIIKSNCLREEKVIQGLKDRNLTIQQWTRILKVSDISKYTRSLFILDLDGCTQEIFEIFIQHNLDAEYMLKDIINHKNFPVDLVPKIINLNETVYKLVEKRFKDTINVYALTNFKYVKNSDVAKLVKNIDDVDTLIFLVHNNCSDAALKKLSKMSLTEKDFVNLLNGSRLYYLENHKYYFDDGWHNGSLLGRYIIEMVLNHKNCTITTICTVLTSITYSQKDDAYKIILGKLKNLTIDQIKQLYSVNDYKINEYLLSLPNCPLGLLLDSITNCTDVRRANNIIESLKTKELTKEHIIQLSKCTHWAFRAFAASHELCPVDVLNELAKDEDTSVQSAVASNPNCPVQTLLKIATKVKDVISNDRISGEILTNLYGLCDESYYQYIAANPNCPADIRKQIEGKNIKFNNILFIRTESGLNADGFDVEVYENDDSNTQNKIFTERYRYGYNASYKKDFAEEYKPFTTDILVELANKYNIDKITVGAGTYVFSGKPMTEDDCKDFVKKYIQPNNMLSKLYDA